MPIETEGGWHQFFWVFHVLTFVWFLVILPTTKLRHMLTSPANMYLAPRPRPKGAMREMPNLLEADDIETVGASVVGEFTWKQLLDTDACTVCGRCTSVCPANTTGKPLDPREIVLKLGEVAARTAASPVSPPVGLAAYAAAAIAKSPPIPTGLQGFMYDIRTAILPFMFIFNTDLILWGVNTWTQGLLIFAMAADRPVRRVVVSSDGGEAVGLGERDPRGAARRPERLRCGLPRQPRRAGRVRPPLLRQHNACARLRPYALVVIDNARDSDWRNAGAFSDFADCRH